jgi:hypothetical protein
MDWESAAGCLLEAQPALEPVVAGRGAVEVLDIGRRAPVARCFHSLLQWRTPKSPIQTELPQYSLRFRSD